MPLLYSPLLLIFYSWPSHLCLQPVEGSPGSRKLNFCRYFPCCYDAIRSRQTPGGGLKYFFFYLWKAAFLFPVAQFLPVLRTLTLETKPKQNGRGPCWRLPGGVFLNLAEAMGCFHRLRCLQLLSTELFILITSLVFFHHVHVWLDWYGCMCACVCVLYRCVNWQT